MMLVAAVAGALVVVGALGIVVGLRGVPEAEPAARPARRTSRAFGLVRVSRRTRVLLLTGLVLGCWWGVLK